VSRQVHEVVVERAAARLAAKPNAMQIRRATFENPYGILITWMGSTHLLTKTLDHVSTEMSLHVLAYNMKRTINLVGTKRLLEAIYSLRAPGINRRVLQA
jgi:transposase